MKIIQIKKENIDFSLIVVGKQYSEYPEIFDIAKNALKNEIIYFGYAESRKKYLSLLSKADILPVTSNQDFFGISIMEAICSNCYPILPNRLTYPELLDMDINIFYNKNNELKKKIIESINNIKNVKNKTLNFRDSLFYKFDWETMSVKYDSLFQDYFI